MRLHSLHGLCCLPWPPACLLNGSPAAAGCSVRAVPPSTSLICVIFYCPLADQYGSPTLDDIATFSRLFNAAYEAAVGEAAAGAVEIEVSSAVGVSVWRDFDLADAWLPAWQPAGPCLSACCMRDACPCLP